MLHSIPTSHLMPMRISEAFYMQFRPKAYDKPFGFTKKNTEMAWNKRIGVSVSLVRLMQTPESKKVVIFCKICISAVAEETPAMTSFDVKNEKPEVWTESFWEFVTVIHASYRTPILMRCLYIHANVFGVSWYSWYRKRGSVLGTQVMYLL